MNSIPITDQHSEDIQVMEQQIQHVITDFISQQVFRQLALLV
jgi:hypothetical protein